MPEVPLGRLERVLGLRGIWPNEATDFTPWLAQAENLSILGEALGIDISLEALERRVGPFRADILCKDLGTDTWVLIENQLESTDHGHLGQLLTYAAGLETATIVWVAGRFTEEHRATLDWLNRITDESIRFFGAEIELWRIGTSPIAPRFNIVAKPNDWTRSVAEAARAISDEELSDHRTSQRNYWSGLHQELNNLRGPVSGTRTPQPQAWMNYAIGRAGFMLGVAMIRPKREIRAELYIDGESAKAFFHRLKQKQVVLEQELGYPLEWEEMPGRRACRVATYLRPANADDKTDWPRQQQWLAARLNELHRVLSPRIRILGVDMSEPDSIEVLSEAGAALQESAGHVEPAA